MVNMGAMLPRANGQGQEMVADFLDDILASRLYQPIAFASCLLRDSAGAVSLLHITL
jgi:hypothetical protein